MTYSLFCKFLGLGFESASKKLIFSMFNFDLYAFLYILLCILG